MKLINSVAVVGNGRLIPEYLNEIKRHTIIVGVDRAAYWLLHHNVIPDAAVGDFDSVTAKELEEIKRNIKKVESFSSKKDFTDMELALQYAKSLQPKTITMFGAIGNRLDHSLGNIFLLDYLSHEAFDLRLTDDTNECLVMTGKKSIKKNPRFPYVSLLSLGDTATVSLSGFVYSLDHQQIRRGQTIGISNEIQQIEGKILVHTGKVLVIQSRDAIERGE